MLGYRSLIAADCLSATTHVQCVRSSSSPSVVKVFEDTMKRVSAGDRSDTASGEIGAVDVGDEAKRHAAVAVVP